MKYLLIGLVVLAGAWLWISDNASDVLSQSTEAGKELTKETVGKSSSPNNESSQYLSNSSVSSSLDANKLFISAEINAYDHEVISAGITPNFVNAGEYYKKHLKEALAGNAYSMYLIGRVNTYCGEIEPGYSVVEMVERLKAWNELAYAQGRLNDFYKSLVDMQVKDCTPVWSQYLDEQPNWYELGKEQGGANAEYVLNSRELNSRTLPDLVANKLYGRAIANKDPDPMISLPDQLAYDEKQTAVWDIVSCHYFTRCNDNIKRQNLEYHFLISDIDDINQESDKLIGLIESGEIINYDFFAQADRNPEGSKYKLNEKYRSESHAFQ